MNNNNNNIFNSSHTNNLAQELVLNRAEFDRFLDHGLNPALRSAGREVVTWDRDTMLGLINEKLAKEKEKLSLNPERITDTYTRYLEWEQRSLSFRLKGDSLWDNIRNKHLVKDIINEETSLNNSNISNVNEFLRTNKETILSEANLTTTAFTGNKPLGSLGDVTLNELINKGIEMVESPLVKMIKENVNIEYIGTSVTSMIMYKAVVKMFMQSAYAPIPLPESLLLGPSTRPREIALFMLMGAPAIVGALMGINYATGAGSKLIVSVAENTGLEGASSGSSSSSFFLFFNKVFNKLPSLLKSWLKVILKYIVFSFIITIITSLIGYNSNILSEVSSRFNIYLVFVLKLYSILNFFVVLYFLLRIYVLKMFANNKEFLKPENYPKWIQIELIELKDFTVKLTPIELAYIYKHNFFFIKLYSSIVLLCLTTLVIISMY
jgi:hypothetical protein